MRKTAPALPVDEVVLEVKAALASRGRAVLKADPGAGKTTRVPLSLVNEPWLKGKKILMLEPRRLAARACAHYMAASLDEPVGRTIGYRIRMEERSGKNTRILIITEGILTRMIQSDPALEGVGLVIFDEFHERHIHSDLGLALCLESSEVLRPDLKILVMSATMDVKAVSRILDNGPVVQSGGRAFPVSTSYVPPPAMAQADPARRYSPVLEACARAVRAALEKDVGDILVFLPGQAEIRRMEVLLSHLKGKNLDLVPLFGNLSLKDQARAIKPSGPGRRKIVLSTAIAETSLTIEGIRVVVDSGLMRVSRFSSGTGMSRLETVAVSKASADQRRGRAGRTSPGTCYRVWSPHVHQGLVPFSRPEIMSKDLCSLVLELALWGVKDPCELKWLDPPPPSGVNQARDLLIRLRALDPQGRITDHGREIARAGVHPRLAHMIFEARQWGLGALACRLAALLENRDILDPGRFDFDPDIRLRLEILEQMERDPGKRPLGGVKAGPAAQVMKTEGLLQKRMSLKPGDLDMHSAGRLLALAFPERIAKKRSDLSYVMASGTGAFFKGPGSLSQTDLVVAARVDGNPRNARIFLAAPYGVESLETDFRDRIRTEEILDWDQDKLRVRAVSRRTYGRLVLEESSRAKPDPEKVKSVLIKGIRMMGINRLPWHPRAESLRHRILFLKNRAGMGSLPDLSDQALAKELEQWLGPFLDGIRSMEKLRQVDLFSALSTLLTWEEQQQVEKNAPTHIRVPSGSRIALKYTLGRDILDSPVLAVRLQEMFGLTKTPRVCGVPVTIHLLSPAGRPVQITRDLENFWKTTYQEVKKDLKGRYPKHYWPDNPLDAVPTRRVKPRK